MEKEQNKPPSARRIFATRMKRFRLAKKLSQEKLAALASLHTNYVSSVERAERNISIDNIEKIARALGVPVATLLSPSRVKEG